MVIHHINIIPMVMVKNNFFVQIVIKIYLVQDIFLKMNVHIVLNVMKIVLLIHVKNVEKKLVLIQKIYHIKIVIGMKNVFFVQCVKIHLLINHLLVKMINYFVVNVIINNLPHVVINVIKYLNQVQKKLEYRGQQFHEHCFTCYSCSQPIGTKSFIPKDQKSYCVPCYEEHFATKCTRCLKVIIYNLFFLITFLWICVEN